MDFLRILADPAHVAKFQNLCGVESLKPVTCDQQTQTRRQSSDSDSNSSSEHGGQPSESKLTHSHSAPASVNDERVISGNSNSNIEPNGTLTCIDAPSIDHTCGSDDHQCNVRHRTQAEELNNNTKQTDNLYSNGNEQEDGKLPEQNGKKNIIKKDKSNKKNGYHIIKPTSRVHSKGSIFECNGHATNDKSAPNGHVSSVNSTTPYHSKPSRPQPLYRIKYKSLLYLARFGAFLGNEEFYLTFFPFCVWNLDFLIVRQVGILWAAVMYLGQATKDYLRWPRPPCPPVVRLETHYLQEYSMPSTHAMAGTAIPLYMAYLAVERYQVPVVVAAPVALLWFSITCMSRLYLGVHTILDLLAGFVYSILIFFTFLRYVERYDLYQQTHPFAAPVLISTALALCTVFYPSNCKNSSKGDAVQIVAATTGCGMGGWLGYQLGYMQEPEVLKPYVILMPSLYWLGLALLRFLTGLVFVAVLYVIVRLATIRFFSYMYGLDKPDKNFPSVMTAYKFTTYLIIGAGITFAVPLVHMYLGIHRAALFSEVL